MEKLISIAVPDPRLCAILTEALSQAGMGEFCACIDSEKTTGSVYRLALGMDGPACEGTEYFKSPARLGAVLERALRLRDLHAMRQQKGPLGIGPYLLYPAESALRLRNNDREAPVKLTDKEVQILQILAQSAPESVSRQTLLDRVWGYAPGIETHTLETHIYRLRQKIEPDPGAPALLLTEDAAYKLNI